LLRDGSGGPAIGTQFELGEWLWMMQVSIQSQQESRTFLDDADARVPMTMNASFVPLGLAEPALQVQIVLRKTYGVAANTQPRLKAGHDLGIMLVNGIFVALESLEKFVELSLAVDAETFGRIKSDGNKTQLTYVGLNLMESFLGQSHASLDASGQPP
jgi:hypothetical protein